MYVYRIWYSILIIMYTQLHTHTCTDTCTKLWHVSMNIFTSCLQIENNLMIVKSYHFHIFIKIYLCLNDLKTSMSDHKLQILVLVMVASTNIFYGNS